jgi:hypothetical protein
VKTHAIAKEKQFTPKRSEMVQQLCISSAQTVPGFGIDVTILGNPGTEAKRKYVGAFQNCTNREVDKLVISGLDSDLQEEETTTDDLTFKEISG